MKFTQTENDTIKLARTNNPTLGQRTLANTIAGQMFGWENQYGSLNNRTKAAIYGAIRTFDANAKGLKVGNVTAGKRRRRSIVSS